ncbi:hypothetical protein M9Y10_022471 [Tritrichomonas musculus]|uniref:RRM domain-containing protein n=1 Tax=Tritrichomonas musculus TaxID=1915356 RepID=A0ABR2KSC3_9EUKA
MPPKYAEDIVALFRPRPKLRFVEPIPRPKPQKFTGISQLLPIIKQIDNHPSSEIQLPANEARIKRREQRVEANRQRIAAQKQKYHPTDNPNATSNPYNTLFISGLPDDVTEDKIRYELGTFGPIKSIKFVYNSNTNKRKPYCFCEFEREDSLKNALIQGARLYFNNKKMIVDCERGRTVDGWLPRRLGGGIGGASRRFSKKLIVLEVEKSIKRKSNALKYGKRYRGTAVEESKRRDEKLGIDRSKIRQYHMRNNRRSNRRPNNNRPS